MKCYDIVNLHIYAILRYYCINVECNFFLTIIMLVMQVRPS
jgi:hypothetical protein